MGDLIEPEASTGTPPETPAQDATDWKAEARKWETRAKENTAAAERLAELEEAGKTEIQKVTDAAAAAEARATAAESVALRLRVAAKHGISDDDADLFLTGTDEAALTKQAERLAQRADDRRNSGNYVPDLGRRTESQGGTPGAEFANFLSGQLGR